MWCELYYRTIQSDLCDLMHGIHILHDLVDVFKRLDIRILWKSYNKIILRTRILWDLSRWLIVELYARIVVNAHRSDLHSQINVTCICKIYVANDSCGQMYPDEPVENAQLELYSTIDVGSRCHSIYRETYIKTLRNQFCCHKGLAINCNDKPTTPVPQIGQAML